MKPIVVPFTPESRVEARWYLNTYENHYGTQFSNIEADYAALHQLITQYECQSVAEIGTWEGYAMMFMWLHPNIERAVAVDICQDYGHGHHCNMKPGGYGSYFKGTPVELVVCRSDDWKADKEFDMVFVDGDHSFEQATRDLATAKRAARKIVAFHDWDNGNPGVNEAILAAPDKFKLVDGSSVAFVEL